jgi:hypothetical protein
MSREPENFDRLVKLLQVKRRESPPVGYFDDFSDEVIARIKAGAVGEPENAMGLPEGAGWLSHVWALLEAKPILAGGFGVVVCGLVLSGVFYSQQLPGSGGSEEAVSLVPLSGQSTMNLASIPLSSTDSNATVNPQLPPGIFDGGLFLKGNSLEALPATFQPNGK